MEPTYQHGQFMWHELVTSDTEAAARFYEKVAGWKTHQYYPKGSNEPYTTWIDHFGPLGALLSLERAREPGITPHWFANVVVRDLEVAVDRILEAGGRLVLGPEAMGTVGRWAVFRDFQGAKLAVFTPKDPLEARHPWRHGGIVWNALACADHRASFAFYQNLFDWQRLDTLDPDGPNEQIIYGAYGKPLGSMSTATSPEHQGWTFAIGVADHEAAVARAVELGGSVLPAASETLAAAGVTRMLDPQGVSIALKTQMPENTPSLEKEAGSLNR
ncbi:VOC family protein [Acanthopleuribacter pedis]|uniref:VOC family protein n=1 Tax=Acanthopleuribacter pedis TaxID=442870 RepID=A0A8J7U2G4_9BACT|nr:VOC family protein [Acanthopleuribacter pedis]MBO1319293.1 VOC family protein [Acanthopleuribacter pedis]